MKYILSCLSALLLSSIVVPSSLAQISLGADFVSRYVWRGLDFGESFSVQPALTLELLDLKLEPGRRIQSPRMALAPMNMTYGLDTVLIFLMEPACLLA